MPHKRDAEPVDAMPAFAKLAAKDQVQAAITVWIVTANVPQYASWNEKLPDFAIGALLRLIWPSTARA